MFQVSDNYTHTHIRMRNSRNEGPVMNTAIGLTDRDWVRSKNDFASCLNMKRILR